MTEMTLKNNQAVIIGEIASEFEYSHEVFGEGFYLVNVKVGRLSKLNDIIPILISERLIDVKQPCIGKYVEVHGQFRSYNRHEGGRTHLMLSLFARDIEFVDEIGDRKPNEIFLDGFICKTPVYRTTPLGREIADVLLAVNRAYSKSDYIPCICWGRNARYAGKLSVGSRIQVLGRIQSRVYQKRISDNEVINRIAYEISVSKLEYCEDEINHEQKVAEAGKTE